MCVLPHFYRSYKLKGNTHELDPWGHEYLRALAGDIGREYAARVTAKAADLKDMEDDGAWWNKITYNVRVRAILS